MLLVWSFLVLWALSGVHGKPVQIEWTPLGVADYRDPSNPLQTEAGDILTLNCSQVSNLFIQEEEVQHKECNANAGSGQYGYNGFCPANGELTLTLTVNSQNLMNTFNFENNRLYYFASYSNGVLGDANNRSINSGGQCEDGLKMVVLIGEIPTPDVGGNQPGGSGGLPIAIIAGAVGGGATIVLILSLCICICLCCCYRNRAVKVVQEEPDATMDVKSGSTVNPPKKPKEPETKPKVVDSSPTVNGKVKKDSPTATVAALSLQGCSIRELSSETKKFNIPDEGPAAKSKAAASAKTNSRNVLDTTQTQRGPPKGTRNATNNNLYTTHNRTGAVSSPSQINKTSKGDNKTTIHNGRANHKGTVQSTTGSSVAASGHNRPAPPPPKAAMKHEKVQGKPAPTQSLPPSSIATKHERVHVNLSLPPSAEKTRNFGRTQKNTNGVSYNKNGAVNL